MSENNSSTPNGVESQETDTHSVRTEEFKPSVTSGHSDYREVSSFHNPIDTKHWILVNLVLSIPFVNIIMLIIWMIGDHPTSLHKRGFARGYVLALIIVYVVVFTFTFFLGSIWLDISPLFVIRSIF